MGKNELPKINLSAKKDNVEAVIANLLGVKSALALLDDRDDDLLQDVRGPTSLPQLNTNSHIFRLRKSATFTGENTQSFTIIANLQRGERTKVIDSEHRC